MQNIEWKPIKDYEELYMVSNTGLVKRIRFINGKYNFKKERLLKLIINKDGYMFVRLCKNGKTKNMRIHKLVANAFLGESNLQVDHIDGNKQNNNLNNLEYVTPKENTQRAWKKGIAKNTEYQRQIAKKVMVERWKNNSHRKVRGTKRSTEEKREYQRRYYREHRQQFKSVEYKVGE